MNLIDKVILEWSYRTKKGYPDLNNEEDLRLFEALFGFDLTAPINEAPKIPFDELAPTAKEVGNRLIQLLGISKEQFKGLSKTNFNIYVPAEDRPLFFDKIQDSGEFGNARKERSGNWKLPSGVIFSLKPTGEKAGEYFELKPQQLGITSDKEISLSQLQSELIRGIDNNKVLSDNQKRYLRYAVTKEGSIDDIPAEDLPNGFFNEVFKNFGEPHGALIYGKEKGCDRVLFPAAGNYPLIDYILFDGEERIQVSAKTAKGMGNTVKYNDVIKLAELAGGEIPTKIKRYTDIINNNSVYAGAFEAIEVFGSNDLKKKVEEYKKLYPHYPKLGNRPEDRQSHQDRITIEKAFVNEINTNPELDFNELFNEYVVVRYVKYKLNPSTAEPDITEITQGNFKVRHKSKNSAGHDSDKLGLEVLKAK